MRGCVQGGAHAQIWPQFERDALIPEQREADEGGLYCPAQGAREDDVRAAVEVRVGLWEGASLLLAECGQWRIWDGPVAGDVAVCGVPWMEARQSEMLEARCPGSPGLQGLTALPVHAV